MNDTCPMLNASTLRPENIGISAIEVYFPKLCVDQTDLEIFDGVSQGKYTIGLGQGKMSFCSDREDIYSIALTAVSNLLHNYKIPPTAIGRLEVGTETLLDKSKSVKSVLMQLFQPHDNTNIEGVDTVNACYGGTNALFNAVNWMESSAWDGRYAIVVAGDIALYGKGNARPTGGAGCVALLITPNAPLIIEAGLRATYVAHTYDFYKPNLSSEYPIVDGAYSIRCYLEALDKCYSGYTARERKLMARNPHRFVETLPEEFGSGTTPLDRFDFFCFHSPTCKLVVKSYARLLFNDYLHSNPSSTSSSPSSTLSSSPTLQSARPLPHRVNAANGPTISGNVNNNVGQTVQLNAPGATSGLQALPPDLAAITYSDSFGNAALEKHFINLNRTRFQDRVAPSTLLPNQCGNMYCASLYSSLASLVFSVPTCQLLGSRIGLFSFGSGLASSMFSLRIASPTSMLHSISSTHPTTPTAAIDLIKRHLNLTSRLAARQVCTPAQYDEYCNLRQSTYQKSNYSPQTSLDTLFPNTYYLTNVDDKFRRTYART